MERTLIEADADIERREGPRSTPDGLYWSKRGEVACAAHAPNVESPRWGLERWCPIPHDANGRHGLAYQCPRCAPDGRPHRHQKVERGTKR